MCLTYQGLIHFYKTHTLSIFKHKIRVLCTGWYKSQNTNHSFDVPFFSFPHHKQVLTSSYCHHHLFSKAELNFPDKTFLQRRCNLCFEKWQWECLTYTFITYNTDLKSKALESRMWQTNICEDQRKCCLWQGDLNNLCERSLSNCTLNTAPWDIKTPWPEFASELFRPSNRSLLVKLVPTFADRGCHMVNVTDPYGHTLSFPDLEPLLFGHILQKCKFNCYISSSVHGLLEYDCDRRVQLCELAGNQFQEDPNIFHI
jgi:hypothetical protein